MKNKKFSFPIKRKFTIILFGSVILGLYGAMGTGSIVSAIEAEEVVVLSEAKSGNDNANYQAPRTPIV